jgi:hypothetical protein
MARASQVACALMNSKSTNLQGQWEDQARDGTPQVGTGAIGKSRPGAGLAPPHRQRSVHSDLDANADCCQLTHRKLAVKHLTLALQQPVAF